jgi:hypothetical protein
VSDAGFTWSQVVARRLGRHGLSQPVPAARLSGQVGVIGGAHAQVMSAAELSVGLRVAGVTRSAVRQALWSDRTLVKTYGPRGTVHLLPAEGYGSWMAALSAVPPAPRPAAMSMTDSQTDEVVAAIGTALTDAELTVDELSDAVVSLTGPWAGDLVMPAFQGMWPRWRQAVATAAHRGTLCFGPNRGRKVTYTNPSTWIPGSDLRTGEPAGGSPLGALACRYLHAYGPATPPQFAQWLSAPRPWAANLFEELATAGTIERVTVDGEPAWVAAGDTTLPDEPARGIHLLPYFDAYAVGSHPRPDVFPGRAAERALTGGQAGTVPVLLVDGIVGGVWHQRRSGRKLAVTVEPFRKLTAGRRHQLDDQVTRVGEILEATPDLTIGPVTAGSHL